MTRGRTRSGLMAIAVSAVVCGAAATSAKALFYGNNPNIDRTATQSRSGDRVRATGPLICSSGERVSLRVTVTQKATEARARGRWKAECTGAVQHWGIRAGTRGPSRFEPGSGKVCVLGKTRAADQLTDRQRWCRRVDVSKRF